MRLSSTTLTMSGKLLIIGIMTSWPFRAFSLESLSRVHFEVICKLGGAQ
jgi:hypothetical protein